MISEAPAVNIPELLAAPRIEANHPSFDAEDESGRTRLHELQGLVDEGFADLCKSTQDAEQHLGAAVVPSPLGDVVKKKEDGSTKHRLIQDLRSSRVNES